MFTDLPTPAYNQTTFQSFGNAFHQQNHGGGQGGGYAAGGYGAGEETGFTPMHPSYGNYQMAPQGDGAFGSLNDALRSPTQAPTVYSTGGNGVPSSRGGSGSDGRSEKAKRRESGMLGYGSMTGMPKKDSRGMGKVSEEGGSF